MVPGFSGCGLVEPERQQLTVQAAKVPAPKVGNNLNIVSMCAVSPVVHTSNISSCQKNFFNIPVAVKNSIKVGPLVFFVITENIMKCPVFIVDILPHATF